jgi:3-oxoacyl-[acyl-carrier protein] reductase
MDLGLQGKVAVVAASSTGLGRATAEVFAQEGARVVVNGRHAESLRRTADEIRAATGAEVEEIVGDLSVPDDCRRLIDQAVGRFGRIDALVTNAGGPPAKRFEDVGDEDWDSAYRLTLGSVIALVRCALPHLRESRGAVASISSYVVKQPDPVMTLSNTFRTGVIALLKTLSEDLAGEGVRFNSVGPGLIMTDRQVHLTEAQSAREGIPYDEALARREVSVPLGRFGTPREFANVVVFLCSDAAAYVTGQTVLVDAGLYKGLM